MWLEYKHVFFIVSGACSNGEEIHSCEESVAFETGRTAEIHNRDGMWLREI